MHACALSDYHGLYGAIEFYQKAEKHSIKPLIGVELFCVHDARNHNDHAWWYLVLLAKTTKWYQDLLELISFAQMEWYSQIPRIDITTLKQYGSDLYCLIWTPRSMLGELIMHNESSEKLHETLQLLKQATHPNQVYCMISAHDENKDQSLKTVNQTIKQLAHETQTAIVITSDVHYIHKEDQKPFEIALSIKDWKRIYDETRRKVEHSYHLASLEEITAILLKNWYTQSEIDTYASNNGAIAQTIDCTIALNQLLFPAYDSPPAIKELFAQHHDSLVEE